MTFSHYNYWIVIFLMMTGLYVVIARGNFVKKIIGLNIFQVSVIMFYVSMGKVRGGTAPIEAAGFELYSNPLPHVLMLTAIVVGVATTALALAIILVFLVLAAQYESWSSPAAVIMVVPLAVLGTVIAVMMKGADNNVYTQIGITLLIALASKNAILIVEFAMAEQAKGKSIIDAAVDAAKLRFRPILMTAISSIAGFMPLVVAAGAGAASQQAIGTAVVGGMIAATVMSVTFTPAFYVVMKRLGKRGNESKKDTAVPTSGEATDQA